MSIEKHIIKNNAAIKYAKTIFGETPTSWCEEEIVDTIVAFGTGWDTALNKLNTIIADFKEARRCRSEEIADSCAAKSAEDVLESLDIYDNIIFRLQAILTDEKSGSKDK